MCSDVPRCTKLTQLKHKKRRGSLADLELLTQRGVLLTSVLLLGGCGDDVTSVSDTEGEAGTASSPEPSVTLTGGVQTTGSSEPDETSDATEDLSSSGSVDSTGMTTAVSDTTGGVECGDGVLEGDEECDGTELGRASCVDIGFDDGVLGCTNACTLDVSACVLFECDNGVLDPNEDCDGARLGGESCESQGFYSGDLGCTEACTFDTAGCNDAPVCGNGIIEDGESCDGAALAGLACTSLGFAAGDLACAGDCSEYDLSECTDVVCGDATAEELEACDGADLLGESCESQGYLAGALACLADCSDYDASACIPDAGDGDCCASNGSPGCDDGSCELSVCATDPLCCDDTWGANCAALAMDDCATCGGGYVGDCCVDNGSAGCEAASCVLSVCAADPSCCADTWDGVCAALADATCGVCVMCGDDMAELGEVCDGADLLGSTCVSVGFLGGALACAADCSGFDTSGCIDDFGGGDCCSDNGSPGCDENTCEAVVCGIDGLCCGDTWDGTCADIAATECMVCGGGYVGDCCSDNGSPGCDENTCTLDICALDPTCCSDAWDDTCSDLAAVNCDACIPVCGDDVAGFGEACDGADLNAESCATHGFAGGTLVCAGDCSGFDTSGCSNDGECCISNVSPGCNDAACEAIVCADNPNCCDVFWDGACSEAATTSCGICTAPPCGDDHAGYTEVCDGADLGGQTCDSLGLVGGVLSCEADCSGFDTSACTFDGLEWLVAWPAASVTGGMALALDVNENVLVVGNENMPVSEQAGFVRRYDPTGELLWSDTYGQDPFYYYVPRGVAASPNDESFAVVGYRYGNGGPVHNRDLFVRKYDGASAFEWNLEEDSGIVDVETSRDVANGVIIDPSDRIYVVGQLDQESHMWRYSSGGVLEVDTPVRGLFCVEPNRSAGMGVALGPLSGDVYVSGFESECDDDFATRRMILRRDTETLGAIDPLFSESFYTLEREGHGIDVRDDEVAVFTGRANSSTYWTASADDGGGSVFSQTQADTRIGYGVGTGPRDESVVTGTWLDDTLAPPRYRGFVRILDEHGAELADHELPVGEAYDAAVDSTGAVYTIGREEYTGYQYTVLRKWAPQDIPPDPISDQFALTLPPVSIGSGDMPDLDNHPGGLVVSWRDELGLPRLGHFDVDGVPITPSVSEAVADDAFRVDVASTAAGITMAWRDGQNGATYARTYDDTLSPLGPATPLFDDGYLLDLHVVGVDDGFSVVQHYWHVSPYQRRIYASKYPDDTTVLLGSISTGSQLPNGPIETWTVPVGTGSLVAFGGINFNESVIAASLDAGGNVLWGPTPYDGFGSSAPLVAVDDTGTQAQVSAVWQVLTNAAWYSYVVPAATGAGGIAPADDGFTYNVGAAVGSAFIADTYYLVYEGTDGDFFMVAFDTLGQRVSDAVEIVDRAGLYCGGRCGRMVETPSNELAIVYSDLGEVFLQRIVPTP